MLFQSILVLTAPGFASLLPPPQQVVPGDTYFSLAITENSHNHVGASKLFLNFQEQPFTAPDAAVGEVVSIQVGSGAIALDGDDSDWNPTYLTTVRGLVQNNYPLSEFIDAGRLDITVGSAWDPQYVYLLVQWEDAGHTASTRYQKWLFGDQGAGEEGWNRQVHVGATVGAPNGSAVNATGHVLAATGSEDRVFLMFPIVDTELNFTPNGPGCALYCHTNLVDDFPWQNYTGDGVVAMHTNLAGDTADIWHWKSSRSEPSGNADDKYLAFGVGSENGRKSDSGSAAYSSNGLSGGHPTWMHRLGLGYQGDVLPLDEVALFEGTAVQGDQIPRNVSVVPTGSRADVETASSFDPTTKTWTVEFRRLRDTGNVDDHAFEGLPAAVPTTQLVTSVDPAAGQSLYFGTCATCHLPGGRGVPLVNNWATPRIQRASGGQILEAIQTVPDMLPLQGVYSEQQIEDIAAYLQNQAIFEPTWTLQTVVSGGPTAAGILTSQPVGIDCPSACSTELIDGTEVTLQAAALPGYTFVGWSGPCSGTGDCSFTLTGNTTATATYAPDCSSTTYCTAKINSCGTVPAIQSTGSPSASATSGFVVSATGARGPKSNGSKSTGVLIYTDGGRLSPAIPFGQGGFLCIDNKLTPVRRGPTILASGGTTPACDAVFTVDVNAYAAGQLGGNPKPFLSVPGTQVNCQYWGRDTFAHGNFMSDALEYTVCP